MENKVTWQLNAVSDSRLDFVLEEKEYYNLLLSPNHKNGRNTEMVD